MKSRIDPNDCVVLFADLQKGIADLPLTVTQEHLKKGVLALAKLAKLFGMPAVISGVQPEGEPAQMLPEIKEGFGPYTIVYRTTADSLLNGAIAQAIEATGRKTLLISGVATELAVQLPALTGVDLGYRTFIVVDACGGVSARTEEAAIHRVLHNGGNTVSVMTLAGELAGDFSKPQAQAAIGILFEMARA
jgi:nicotinamidase-related amidase